MNNSIIAYEDKEKVLNEVEGDITAITRKIMLLEEEQKKSEMQLATTVTKLAVTSKDADNILKQVKVVESSCMNNEVTLEELDKNLRITAKIVCRLFGKQQDVNTLLPTLVDPECVE